MLNELNNLYISDICIVKDVKFLNSEIIIFSPSVSEGYYHIISTYIIIPDINKHDNKFTNRKNLKAN